MAARTPLHARHLAAHAVMVEFAGYEMPLRYSSMRDEHVAVRTRAGLFDLSHMGEVRLTGSSAEATVQRLVANDVSTLTPGRALYAVVCNDDAGIVDDVLVYRVEDGFLVVVNASRRQVDLEWMAAHLLPGTELRDESDETALLAVQGPEAVGDRPDPHRPGRLRRCDSFASVTGEVAGVPCRISRTGYTGEDGLELYCAADPAPALWDALLEAGAGRGLIPAGLGARDTLRLEAGLRLYGQDMDESVDPFSCGLAWTVKLGKGDFIGASRLRRARSRQPAAAVRGAGPRAPPDPPPRDGGARRWRAGRGGDQRRLQLQPGPRHRDRLRRTPASPRRRLSVDIRGEAVPARRVSLPFYGGRPRRT